MSEIRVLISMDHPAPQPPQEPGPEKLSVEDRVHDLIQCIESGHDSGVEWYTLSKLYTSLQAKRGKSERADNLVRMIEPVMAKYGYYGKGAK